MRPAAPSDFLFLDPESGLPAPEERYRGFFENAVEGIFQSVQGGGFLAVNPALAVDILGYESPEEMIATVTDLKRDLYVEPTDRDRLFELLQRHGRVTGFETRFRRKDGQIKWISLAAREVRDPKSGRLLYIEGLNVDISARKEDEERFKRTFDQSPIGASILGLDYRYRRVNEAFARITGYSEDELRGRPFMDITHPEDRQVGMDRLEALCRGEIERYELDKRYVHKSGRVVWVHLSVCIVRGASGQPLYFLPMAEDISERVQAERELAHANLEKERLRRNLETVFRSIPDAIVVVDAQMRVIQSNRPMEETCCLGGDSATGGPPPLTSGSCRRACFDIVATTIRTREPIWEYRVECQGRTPGRVVVLNCSPLAESPGAPDSLDSPGALMPPETETAAGGAKPMAGAVLVIRDITRQAMLEKRLTDLHGQRGIIGKSKVMRDIYAVLDQLSEVESTVLVTGESGTGKELVAEALHYGGPRAKGPMIKVNCSALSESLLESELFGHVRGAFTGAMRDRIGRFEAAEGGSIFLDEIGDVSPRIQLNLLRVLERKEYERVGDSKTRRANVRVIAATNVDLREKIRLGQFREDLYYRLKVMVIHLPPLRDRVEDLPLLAEHFIGLLRARFGKPITRCSEEVMRLFMTYPWPGNVRELKYAIEHACILCPGGEIGLGHLPPELLGGRDARLPSKPELPSEDLHDCAAGPAPLRAAPRLRGTGPAGRGAGPAGLTREAILAALGQAQGNRSRAARLLGVDRRTLYRNMEKFTIV